jgi:hypothetical protein
MLIKFVQIHKNADQPIHNTYFQFITTHNTQITTPQI